MEPDRPDRPSTPMGVAFEVRPKKGFSPFRDLIEQFERKMKKLLIPARFLKGDTPGEARTRPVQRAQEPISEVVELDAGSGGKHG